MAARGTEIAGGRRQARAWGQRVTQTPDFTWFARAGIAARGVVFAVIGVLAVKLALGDGGKATSQQGALKTIAQQPFGKVLLIIVAVGLAGYAGWRLVHAVTVHRSERKDELKERVDGLIGGVAYAALCVTAVRIIAGAGSSGSSGGQADKATGGVLGWPGGPWLVGIAGVVLIGVGLHQGYRGVKRKFLEDANTGEMSEPVEKGYSALGVFGHLARMAVFALIGYFLIKAAIDFNPNKAVALDGALAKLGHASYGPYLLGLVALGLIGFAGFSVAEARYRRI